jgi:hypothetical protein
MQFVGLIYRFVSNFAFLALVYYSLNLMEKYQQRAILAILVLVYAGMRAASAFRSFYSSSASSAWNSRRAAWRSSPAKGRPPLPCASRSSITSRFCVVTAKGNPISTCCFWRWSCCYVFRRS